MPAARPAGGDRDALSVAAGISACVAAYGVYLGLPLILGALANIDGFSNAEIGWIGSAENTGLLIGSVAVSALGAAFRFRTLAAAGIALAIVGDAITPGVHAFGAFCAVRLAAGLGGGMCYSAAVAALSRTRNPARSFSIFVVILVIANSLELWTIPGIVAHGGLRGLYFALAALYAAPVALLRYLPEGGTAAGAVVEAGPDVDGASVPAPWIPASLAFGCLLGIVLFNVAASAFWAYGERIGASIGLSERTVSNVLTICNLVSLTGSVIAYAASRRWGQHRPQLAATALMIAVFAVWALWLTPFLFGLGILIFFQVWSVVSVYQLGTLSAIDRTGRRVALVPAAQGVGQSAGPLFAAALIAWHFGFQQILFAASLFAVGSFAAYGMVYGRLRWIDRAVANG